MLKLRFELVLLALSAAQILVACDKADDTPKAPPTPASAIAPPVAPTGPSAVRYVIEPASKTLIDMPAPKERIRAETTAAKGDLTIVSSDLEKTRGQIKVDLATLATHTFDDATKDHSQTEHAHNWLEAGDLVSPEVREANRWVIFTIREVVGVSVHDLAQIPATHVDSEDTRVVTATVKGDFFLHGHSVPKEVPIEVVFHNPTGKPGAASPTRIEVRTKTPLRVVLAEHDVKPRDSLGKLAQASFSLLGTKVAETADVTFDFMANPAP